MRTILLSAGYGTRLRPLTNSIPKCLVPIHGRPLLEIWLERLTRAGMGPFLVNTHYLASQVKDYLGNSPYRETVSLVHETELLGTAGTLMANIEFFEDADGLLIHADNYCLADFADFYKTHRQRPRECLLTMMTFRTNSPSSCGIVDIDDSGIVRAFYEKVASPPGNLANGAIYILSAQLVEELEQNCRGVQDFSNDVLPQLVGKIYTYETSEIFIDIGTPDSYAQANE